MVLPKTVKTIIEQEADNSLKEGSKQLVRRKGDPEERLEDSYTGIQVLRNFTSQNQAKDPAYDLLPEGPAKKELIDFWMKYHAHFPFPNFTAFYSKMDFCLLFSQPDSDMTQSLLSSEDHFISLLADRKFLFLEDNEHGNNPDYPLLSDIVRDPNYFLKDEQSSEKPDAGQIAHKVMIESAKIIWDQGFMPTHAHRWAYNEMLRNEEEIRAALEKRKRFLQRSKHFLCDGIIQFPTFIVQISGTKKMWNLIDDELCQLFHDFLCSAVDRAYVKKYSELICHAKENSLNAITCVRQYLENSPNHSVCRALVFWCLFTKETTKLARGELETFKFKMPEVKTDRRLTRHTQAPSYRKIECQIMLFDYLLKLFPPKDGSEQEIAYAKFQFHAFTKYNGYTHFRVKDVRPLEYDSENKRKFNFSLIPDSQDYVDHLGGIVRKHILRCISNDVRWLTPGLPNNWNINSSILATMLLQDISRFPKSHRLINRMYAFLKDRGSGCVQIYRNFKGEQSELIAQLEQWCIDNDLIFEDDIPSSDMVIADDNMKLLCSRLVLEYMLKEQILVDVRKGLSALATKLWRDLLLRNYETFDLDEDV